MVIPAHPLALDARRRLDERRQRALTRYYLDAGAGGIAVGVHTTQFAIRHPKVGLYRPVLELATETISEWELRHDRTVLRVAGIIGRTPQALREARIARDLRFDVGLLSLGALPRATVPQLIAHCARTRRLGAGTIIGSGTVSNRDPSRGCSCLVERRMLEQLAGGAPLTPWLRFGDRVRIEMRDSEGASVFGAISQRVVMAPGA